MESAFCERFISPARLLNAIDRHQAPVSGALGIEVHHLQRACGLALALVQDGKGHFGVILRPVALIPRRGVIDVDLKGHDDQEVRLSPREQNLTGWASGLQAFDAEWP